MEENLEHGLKLLGVTDVKDKLQKDVRPSLELLGNAGIKIWMLTADRVEIARCAAFRAKTGLFPLGYTNSSAVM